MTTGSAALRRATVITAVVIMPILCAAWVILFWWPGRTDQLWAWTIKSEMTPITMGSAYLGGAWFFYRVARNPEPGRVVGGLAAAGVLVIALGAATVVHWRLFDHDHVAFWVWAALYFFTPFYLPVLAWANWLAARRGRPEDDGGPLVPRWARRVLVSAGVAQMVAAAALFAVPDLAIDHWPWPMTPLTTRTIASFVAFSGAQLLWVLVDRRWRAVQYGVEALLVGLSVTGLGALAHRSDFTGPRAATVIYAVALTSLVVTFAFLMLQMRGRDKRHSTAEPSAQGRP